jgi:DNA-directed RNA polymerase subunit RPC12/RpoP
MTTTPCSINTYSRSISGIKTDQKNVCSKTFSLDCYTKDPNRCTNWSNTTNRNITTNPITTKCVEQCDTAANTNMVNKKANNTAPHQKTSNVRVESTRIPDVSVECPKCNTRLTISQTGVVMKCPNCSADLFLKLNQEVEVISISGKTSEKNPPPVDPPVTVSVSYPQTSQTGQTMQASTSGHTPMQTNYIHTVPQTNGSIVAYNSSGGGKLVRTKSSKRTALYARPTISSNNKQVYTLRNGKRIKIAGTTGSVPQKYIYTASAKNNKRRIYATQIEAEVSDDDTTTDDSETEYELSSGEINYSTVKTKPYKVVYKTEPAQTVKMVEIQNEHY